VTLTAIADDCDLLRFDQVHIGIPVVIHPHCALLLAVLSCHPGGSRDPCPKWPPAPCSLPGASLAGKARLKARSAPRDRYRAGARDLDQTEGLHQGDEGVEFLARSRHLENEA